MTKLLYTLFLNLIFSTSILAGGGYCNILKVNINIDNFYLQGYVRINTFMNINSDSITSTQYLTNTVKTIPELSDKLILYEYAIPIKYNLPNHANNITYYLSTNHSDTLDTKFIKEVVFLDSLYCYPGIYISSDLEMSDTLWIGKGYIKEDNYKTGDYCSNVALFFENTPESISAYKDIIEARLNEEWEKHNNLVRKIGEKKVIIISINSD
jgi:hypothetical protein